MPEATQSSACCVGAPKLIFPCSGAADVGEIADHAGRQLSREGAGKMFCLAGIGGRVTNLVESTKAAAKLLAIDGCPLDCAKNTLLQAGFTEFEHVRVTDHGMEKGKTPVTDQRVETIAACGRARLQDAAA